MDQVVKRENEEEEKAEPMETASCEEVEDVILAELSRSPKLKPRPSSSTVKLQSLSVFVCVFVVTILFHNLVIVLVHCWQGKQKKPMDKKETLSSVKKGRSDSMIKHVRVSFASNVYSPVWLESMKFVVWFAKIMAL